MNLLQMSLSGAVMILVIVVIRALSIHKLPKNTFLLLWGIALLRLLIPYSLRSAFSVYSLLERLAPATAGKADVPALLVPAPSMAAPAAAHDLPEAVAHVDPWLLIWALGALACGLFFALTYLKCRREFRASLPVDHANVRRWLGQHHLRRGIEIRQSDRISAPLTYGVLRPVILMPKTTDWDDQDTLNYVLTHEYVHIRRFDAVSKLLLTVALCAHWFDPAVWMMYVLANRDLELSCDEAVVRAFGTGAKTAYAAALIHLEETRSGLTPLCSNFSKNAIEERIIAIMKTKKTSVVSLLVALILIFGVTAAFATSAQQPTEPPVTEPPVTEQEGNSSAVVNAADPVNHFPKGTAGTLAVDEAVKVDFTYVITEDGAAYAVSGTPQKISLDDVEPTEIRTVTVQVNGENYTLHGGVYSYENCGEIELDENGAVYAYRNGEVILLDDFEADELRPVTVWVDGETYTVDGENYTYVVADPASAD